MGYNSIILVNVNKIHDQRQFIVLHIFQLHLKVLVLAKKFPKSL